MKKVGIIAAMQEEMEAIKELMREILERKIYDLTFFEGKINQKECVLVQCGVGKVISSRTAQILIDKFDIEYIINVGSAATANDELEIGDIVIGKDLVQHDFDITAFGHKKGYISNVGESVRSNAKLIEKFEEVINDIENRDYKIKLGTIASGDIFCTEVEMKKKINSKFNADAIEMEGAAIAQVCYLDNIPFIIVRSISDNPNGQNNITFEEYLELASKRCREILKKVI
jgi:adenosylhomocysteine nucleosidase